LSTNETSEPGGDSDRSAGLARAAGPSDLIRRLDQLCRKARQTESRALPPAVCWILLDESAGHRSQVGFSGLDALLRAIHQRVRAQLEEVDISARFGLDAIGIILDSAGGERDLEHDAESLKIAVSNKLFEIGDQMIAATVSIVFGFVDEGLRPPEANLVHVANAAEKLSMAGGNRCQNSSARDDESNASTALLGQLTKALRANSLKVVFQPLLATSGPEKERLQLLPRLTEANGALIPAARFIPVAAERGVLPAVDQWMIFYAINMLEKRAASGVQTPTLFVNQSPAVIDDPKFFNWLADQIQTLDPDRRGLVLEFNILDLKSRIRAACEIFARLQNLKIGISIKGIDEKIPEIILLKHLPADYLRMKSDLARRILADRALAERFEAFAKSARSAGRKLIVPMLEDAEEVSRIWQMDVDLIQGNFIQQPSEQSADA